MKQGPIVCRIRATMDRHGMVEPDAKVLVAVSGGPDSVCLLHALIELGVAVEMAHIDHETRDGESGDDARFVESMAQALGIPFHEIRHPVERLAADSKRSFEQVAREVRYAALLDIAEGAGIHILATGHQADDQAETILMRILRGTSPDGLGGIPPVRQAGAVRIVRPLLDCSREEILAYLAERGLFYRVDRSNEDPRFERNRIRHELLPDLRTGFNPRVEEALVRLAEIQREENRYLDREARAFLAGCRDERGELRRKPFAEGPAALQRRALVLLAREFGIELPYARAVAAVDFAVGGAAGRAFDLGAGMRLRNARGLVEIRRGEVNAPETEPIGLRVPGETVAFGKRFRIQHLAGIPAPPISDHCGPMRQVFDANAFGQKVSVRRRRAGDRFQPLGMRGSRKLKDFFIDLGIPAGRRDEEILLVAGNRIVWVVGRGVSAEAAVTDRTRACLEVEVTDASE